jgi:chromosome transmission fidelity protein 18
MPFTLTYPSDSVTLPLTRTDDSQAVEDTLWVDRYRPTRFTELTGNERVARDVMAWVKQWDWCVFGKRRGKKRPVDSAWEPNTEDEFHRPREKVRRL